MIGVWDKNIVHFCLAGSWQSCLGGHDLCEFDTSAVVVAVVGKVG